MYNNYLVWCNTCMNSFTKSEERAANLVYQYAQAHANTYSNEGDRAAATIALLRRALELAGGAGEKITKGEQSWQNQ
jgi:hypothetical protein